MKKLIIMLQTISQGLYISIVISIIYMSILLNIFPNTSININIFYVIAILLIPIFDYLYEYIKNEDKKPSNTSDFIFKISIVIVITCVLFFFQNINIVHVMITCSFILGILFSIDERYYFAIALIGLILTIFGMIFQQQSLANIFSIYVYYFLVGGVTISITNSTLHKNVTCKPTQNIIGKKISFLQKKNIFEIAFVVYFILINIFLFFGKFDFLAYTSLYLLFVYILTKLIGEKLTFFPKKPQIPNQILLEICLTISLLGVIFTKLFLQIPYNFHHYSIFSIFVATLITCILFFYNTFPKTEK